jgi:uncharacterized protein (TIGR03437 family)
MKKVPVILSFLTLTPHFFTQSVTLINAASLSAVTLAPGSIATLKGTHLTTKQHTFPDSQHPPTTLEGVSVTIGGQSAGLFSVSPSQINLLIDPGTPTGTQPVVVTSTTGTQTGTVTINRDSPPGLFSLSGTGTRDGAILNAVTLKRGDFSTQTGDLPTYLALFATGLNTSVAPTVTVGGVPVAVVFAGPAPCCDGLEQVNVRIPDSLAGAGRVPVVLASKRHASNAVEVVLLPRAGEGPFPSDPENRTRSRELSGLASVPGTSLVLSVDQNDDVVRAIDLSLKKVTQVITLTQGAGPRGIAVDAAGRTAVVAESDLGKVAILDLSQFGRFSVAAELPAGPGAVAVAIADTQAVVVNGDLDRVSVIDLERKTVKKTIGVGRGPKAVAADSSAKLAYVVNENEGSVSVVDLVGLMVTRTISLGPPARPESIALAPRGGVAYLTLPAAGPDGRVLVLSPSSGATTSLSANPAYSGGSGAVLVYDSNAYFANQAGKSISVVPISPGSGARRGPITQVQVDRGPRALAIDTQDKLLVVSNEGSGTLVLVDLVTNRVVGRINAVRTLLPGDDDADDHSDRAAAVNLPSVVSPSPRPAGPTPSLHTDPRGE